MLRPIDAVLPSASRHYGGKARNLAALVRAGFPVPMAYALSAEASVAHYQRVLPARLQPAQLLHAPDVSQELLHEARRRVLASELDPDLCNELRRALAALEAAAVEGLAVRSSSTAEDLALASAAGLHVSVLNVRGEKALFDAVRSCFAAAFATHVLSYVHTLGLPSLGEMGVVIQAFVPADVAGVMFTSNPLSGDPDEMVVDAGYGLGVAVTDGRVTPDTYRIEKHAGWVRDRVIGDKRVRVVAADEGGLREEPVDPSHARQQALDEHMLAQLVALGLRVEEHFGDARDVEFAIAGDSIYLLQARPIGLGAVVSSRGRGRKRRRLSSAESRVVWSNLNVGEALPGTATPLTWSVLSEFSERGFTEAFAALGCKVPKDARLLGSFRGRIYLNLTELTEIASQVPGLRPSAVLPLGGGGLVERLEQETPRAASSGFLLRLPSTVTRFVRSHLGFGKRVELLERMLTAERARVEGLDLRILSAPALDATLSDVHRLLHETGTTMLTAYGGLLSALVPLRTTLALLFRERADRMLHTLLSALEDVEAAGAGRALMTTALAFRSDSKAAVRLLSGTPIASPSELPDGEARRAVEALLARYGHRGVREAELSEPRWRERPQLLLDALRVHLAHADEEPGRALDRRIGELRAQSDAVLAEVPLPMRPAFKALLSVVRDHLRLRERLRSHVVRVLGLIRLVGLDASRRLAVREPGIGDDAAFMLLLPELHAVLRGELPSVAGLVRLRRAQYERDRSLPDPPDTFAGLPTFVQPDEGDPRTLRGVGASSGAAEGSVRVLRSSEDASAFKPGEILVVAAADVGLSPLFVVAGGLVTDLGGPLSHACVVAREYGLPAVVNVRTATRSLQTGERVRVDGDAGTVQRLSASHAAP